MDAKYHLTVEENIFVAKRNIVDYLWKSSKLEGISVTYPETEAIFNGLTVQGISLKDCIAVNNLKHAWNFVLENVAYPMDYPLLCKINQLVGGDSLIINAGYIQSINVKIGGTSWMPDLPIELQIKEELSDIQTIKTPTDRAITVMLYCMRKQMFLDGNKRTAMLAGNHIMIANGAGILSVPIEKQEKFKELLIRFYESNEGEEIKKFVYENCIDGMELDKERKSVKKFPQFDMEP